MPSSHRRRLRELVATLILTALGLAFGAGIAAAHVTVNPDSATAGSYAKLIFRVPTESATASTTSLRISLPTDHPFPTVSIMQVPGWTATTVKQALPHPITEGTLTITDAVTSITWTANDGVGVKPGEFNEFPISVGPVPDVPSMQFAVAQTYSDGSVVRWDQARGADGSEPDHPAPVLTISGVSVGGDHPGPTVVAAADPAVATASGTDSMARTLGAIGIVVAALALLVAVLGLRRRTSAGDRS